MYAPFDQESQAHPGAGLGNAVPVGVLLRRLTIVACCGQSHAKGGIAGVGLDGDGASVSLSDGCDDRQAQAGAVHLAGSCLVGTHEAAEQVSCEPGVDTGAVIVDGEVDRRICCAAILFDLGRYRRTHRRMGARIGQQVADDLVQPGLVTVDPKQGRRAVRP